MIDYFSIALTHGLILFALWRLMPREELDVEGAPAEKPLRPWLKGEEAEGESPDA